MDLAHLAHLPTPIRTELEGLRELEMQLLSGIAQAQGEALDALAAERDTRLRRICDALAVLDDATLRRDTLLALAEANQRIADTATTALNETISLSQQGAHQRKAILAYGEIDDTAG